MYFYFQNDGENVTKLEKADILELTVRYLHGLKRKDRLYGTGNSGYTDRFKAGFKHCAIEVSQFLNKIDQNANAHLMRHLSECIQRVDIISTSPPVATPHLNRMASPIVNETHVPQFYAKDFSINMNNNNNNNANPNNNVLKSDTPPVNVNINNNNHYLQQQSNHMVITQERVMYSSRNNNVLDNRPVVVINNENKSPKEEPHSGDVWRPW